MGHSPSLRKTATDPLFEIPLDRASKGSRESSRTLCQELKAAILDGRLTAGAQLPPTRKSASFFGVSRNTAAEVYENLVNEGYAVTRRGSGTFVAKRPALAAPPAAPKQSGGAHYRMNEFWTRPDIAEAMSFLRDQAESAAPSKAASADFRPALVDSRLFPFDDFRRVSAKQLRGLERRPASYKSPQGNQGNFYLREAITKHIAVTRAVVCRPDDVLVTSGAQQAFDLLARVLVASNDIVAVEDPGYPPMRVAFAAAGARIVPVPVDEEGLIVEQLPPQARVICVCPSHQFPLGITMSGRRRKALIEFARKHEAVIVEDDYDGEFRYDGSPLEALRSTAAADVVFYVGTFSKCMLPALRLGFMAAPAWAMPSLVAAKNALDWHCSTPVQSGVAAFMTQGHLIHHVRKMRGIYQKRRQVLLDGLEDSLREWFEPIPSLYGMHVAAVARRSLDLELISRRLLQHHVRMHTFSRYFLGPQTKAGLIFGFGTVDLPDIRRGLTLLRNILSKS